jgi:hypothetical protein
MKDLAPFERRLGRRNPLLGEGSEGAVEAPSDGNDGRNFFLVPQMLGSAIVLGLLGYAGNALVRRLERRLLRWQHPV